MSGLPHGWTTAALQDIADVIAGQAPPGSSYNKDGMGVPLYQGKTDFGDLRVEPPRIWTTKPSKCAEAGDVLLSVRAPVGPTNFAREDCAIGRGLAAIRGRGGIDQRYLLYAVRATVGQLEKQATGTTFAAIGSSVIRNHPIPIAPKAEQVRIVAVIEEQFSRLDAGVTALRRIRQGLYQMRAAVLNAAVSGQLTSPDTGRPRGELPDGWRLCTPRELAQDRKHALAIGPFGSNLKVVDYRDEGVPLVFVRQVRSGSFGGSDTRFISATKGRELGAHGVAGGDVLITKMGEPPGDAVVYPIGYPDAVITADVIKVSVGSDVLADYLALAINSRWVRDQIAAITSGVAQQKVSLARFASSIHVPTPPLPEQRRIVTTVGERMEELARLDLAITAGLNRSFALRSAILARAFSGKLVPQNPTDEPASALIEGLASKRASPNNTKAGKARERRRKATA